MYPPLLLLLLPPLSVENPGVHALCSPGFQKGPGEGGEHGPDLPHRRLPIARWTPPSVRLLLRPPTLLLLHYRQGEEGRHGLSGLSRVVITGGAAVEGSGRHHLALLQRKTHLANKSTSLKRPILKTVEINCTTTTNNVVYNKHQVNATALLKALADIGFARSQPGLCHIHSK